LNYNPKKTHVRKCSEKKKLKTIRKALKNGLKIALKNLHEKCTEIRGKIRAVLVCALRASKQVFCRLSCHDLSRALNSRANQNFLSFGFAQVF
jgi:hypothetical protein